MKTIVTKILATSFMMLVLLACTETEKIQHKEIIKPKNVILMIGDGMGVSQVYAGMTAKHGHLELERCPYTGFIKTYSSDNYITDSAAGATAFACGQKTKNGCISLSSTGDTLKSILWYAEENGLSTGLVAICKITHATPAAFIANNISRENYEAIAEDFLKTDIDVFIGGGRDNFEKRQDSINLSDQLRAANYQLVYDTLGMNEVQEGKLAALLWPGHPPRYSQGRGDFLSKASSKAVDLLNQNPVGFFLMIEGSQIDWGGHDNDNDYVVEEMVDFDNTIGKILDFAEKDGETLVIITADHETGGYALNDGNLKEGWVKGVFTTNHHTGTMVPVFAFGPGAKNFTGIYENTGIFYKIMKELGLAEADIN